MHCANAVYEFMYIHDFVVQQLKLTVQSRESCPCHQGDSCCLNDFLTTWTGSWFNYCKTTVLTTTYACWYSPSRISAAVQVLLFMTSEVLMLAPCEVDPCMLSDKSHDSPSNIPANRANNQAAWSQKCHCWCRIVINTVNVYNYAVLTWSFYLYGSKNDTFITSIYGTGMNLASHENIKCFYWQY